MMQPLMTKRKTNSKPNTLYSLFVIPVLGLGLSGVIVLAKKYQINCILQVIRLFTRQRK